MLDFPGGVSAFYEHALGSFNGDLAALLDAAAQFAEYRKRARQTIAIRSANGRISKAAFEKIKTIEAALKGIRGMSRAKVLAGLIQSLLSRET
jgi:hypothetical protein